MRIRNHTAWDDRSASTAITAVRQGAILIFKALRVTLYSVLAVCEPLVVWGFGFLTLVLFAMVLFFSVLLGLPHFPTKTGLAMGIGSALAIPAYYAVMYLLLPD